VVWSANTSKAILSFGITSPVQAQGIIDEAAKTVTVNVPYGTVMTAMTTAITLSVGASVSPASGAAVNFTGPQTYTVTAMDGSTQAYTVTVALGGISGESDLADIGVSAPLGGDYRLNSDITLSGNWTPIGTSGSPFTGTFDGNGHTVTITGFNPSAPQAGFFGSTNGAVISNLNIELDSVTINNVTGSAGGVVGAAKNTTLENVAVTGSMVVSRNAGGEVGGLVGKFDANGGANRLYRCAANVNITANLRTRGDVGGLLGKLEHNSNAVIEECYSTGNVSVTLLAPSMLFAGGLAGMIDDANTQITIINSYATGDVSASMSSSPSEMSLSGLVGQLRGGGSKTVRYCYASGTVSSQSPTGSTGGLCGELFANICTVQDSAALSPAVSGGEAIRGHRVVGHNNGTCTNNIANSAMTVNGSTVSGAANDGNGADTAPAALTSQPTYAALGWDFAGVWKMNTAAPYYPILRWQE
jgi:hypothetical protein